MMFTRYSGGLNRPMSNGGRWSAVEAVAFGCCLVMSVTISASSSTSSGGSVALLSTFSETSTTSSTTTTTTTTDDNLTTSMSSGNDVTMTSPHDVAAIFSERSTAEPVEPPNSTSTAHPTNEETSTDVTQNSVDQSSSGDHETSTANNEDDSSPTAGSSELTTTTVVPSTPSANRSVSDGPSADTRTDATGVLTTPSSSSPSSLSAESDETALSAKNQTAATLSLAWLTTSTDGLLRTTVGQTTDGATTDDGTTSTDGTRSTETQGVPVGPGGGSDEHTEAATTAMPLDDTPSTSVALATGDWSRDVATTVRDSLTSHGLQSTVPTDNWTTLDDVTTTNSSGGIEVPEVTSHKGVSMLTANITDPLVSLPADNETTSFSTTPTTTTGNTIDPLAVSVSVSRKDEVGSTTLTPVVTVTETTTGETEATSMTVQPEQEILSTTLSSASGATSTTSAPTTPPPPPTSVIEQGTAKTTRVETPATTPTGNGIETHEPSSRTTHVDTERRPSTVQKVTDVQTTTTMMTSSVDESDVTARIQPVVGDTPHSNNLSGGDIAAIVICTVVGGLALIILSVFVVYRVYLRRTRARYRLHNSFELADRESPY